MLSLCYAHFGCVTNLFCCDAVVVYCPFLEVPANGSMRQTVGTRCGSAAWFECENGYGLIGSAYRDCVPEGFWRGVTASCHSMSTH